MQRKKLLSLLKTSIDDKIDIRNRIEKDRNFIMLVPFEVKKAFYDVYNVALELNYMVVNDVMLSKGEEYQFGDLYDMFSETDDSFVDFVITIVEKYGVKENIIFFE